MNFLSHYYFDRFETSAYKVLGGLLPDFLKNANKDWKIHPNRFKELIFADISCKDIYFGWEQHLTIDKYFHSSTFFRTYTSDMRRELAEAFILSPIRPSFLAHISLELLLDGILIKQQLIHTQKFYLHLESTKKEVVDRFLNQCNIQETDDYHRFIRMFLKERYMDSYTDKSKILYALGRIAKRIWDVPFTPQQEEKIAFVLEKYDEKLSINFMDIFNEIESKLD